MGDKNNMNNRLNIGQYNGLKERLKEIEKILDTKTDLDLLSERSEIQFKINRQEINFRLTGNNKYYYANQCAIFEAHVLKHGFGHISAKLIEKEQGINFNEYSINTGFNQYSRDLKRFNSKQELLGFVVGYNTAIENKV